jgi:DNA-binding LytR/AlgR family response regulator
MEEQLDILEGQINRILEDKQISHICHKTTSGTEAFAMYAKQKYDAVFMDIGMPEINGIEIAKKMFETDSDAIIVYVTSFTDYAVRAFEQFIFQYLTKPIDECRLDLVLKKVFEKIEKDILYKNEKNFFEIKLSGKKTKIINKNVLYFEKEANYINIYMENHDVEKPRMTLKELEKIIDMNLYLRCHNGFIVNKSKIKSISTKEIELLSADVKIPVGRGYKNEVVNLWERCNTEL